MSLHVLTRVILTGPRSKLCQIILLSTWLDWEQNIPKSNFLSFRGFELTKSGIFTRYGIKRCEIGHDSWIVDVMTDVRLPEAFSVSYCLNSLFRNFWVLALLSKESPGSPLGFASRLTEATGLHFSFISSLCTFLSVAEYVLLRLTTCDSAESLSPVFWHSFSCSPHNCTSFNSYNKSLLPQCIAAPFPWVNLCWYRRHYDDL